MTRLEINVIGQVKSMGGLHTLECCELWLPDPWLLVSISAPLSKCACAAARALASHAIGEDCPELSLPLHETRCLRQCSPTICQNNTGFEQGFKLGDAAAGLRAGAVCGPTL